MEDIPVLDSYVERHTFLVIDLWLSQITIIYVSLQWFGEWPYEKVYIELG